MRGWTERTEATPWPALTETACHPESWKGSRRWCKVPMLPSGLAEVVADEEDLARFLTQSSHFNTEIVKPGFLPVPRAGRLPFLAMVVVRWMFFGLLAWRQLELDGSKEPRSSKQLQ